MNLLPGTLSEKDRPSIDALSSDQLWQDCQDTIKEWSFEQAGYDLEVEDYHLLFYWAIQKSPCYSSIRVIAEMVEFQSYLMLSLLPNDYTLPRVQKALAPSATTMSASIYRRSQQTTLADWVVSEGLAESFSLLYGKELIGPWVTSTSPEQLEEIKPIISVSFS